jgi:polysaccharide export outer membrane protein
MPNPCLPQRRTTSPRMAKQLRAVTLLLLGAACLGGCTGSSGNTAAMNGGAGDASGYNSQGVVTSLSAASADGSGFAPTAAGRTTAASQAADKLTSAATVGTNAYMIGPMDVLAISVYQVPDLTKTVQVGDDGMINYPLVGDVPAGGKTAHDLERELQAKLGAKFVRSPQVSVFVQESNSQRVTVEGSVKNSGVFSMKGRTTLVQVMAMAGGVNMDTDSGEVIIFRTINGTRSAARFDIDAIKAGNAVDPELQPGDVIVVDTSATKLAFANLMKVLPLATTAAIFSGM